MENNVETTTIVTQPAIEEPAITPATADEQPPQETTPAAAPKKRGRKTIEKTEEAVTTEAPVRKPRAPRKKAETVIIEQVKLEAPTPEPEPMPEPMPEPEPVIIQEEKPMTQQEVAQHTCKRCNTMPNSFVARLSPTDTRNSWRDEIKRIWALGI